MSDNPAMATLEGTTLDPNARWQAGDLCIDVALQQVKVGGRAVELPKLSFELLLTLVQHSPRFVSNDELMSAVWRGIVVSPETVTQRVKLLRDALGDDPKQPRYIEGLRGRGYRLIPEVKRNPPASAESATLPSADAGSVSRDSRKAWLGIALALMAVLTATIAWQVGKPRSAAPVAQQDRTVAVLPLEALAGEDSKALAAGLADSMLVQLSGVSGLNLIAGNSSPQFGTRDLDLQAVAEQLGARYLITGSVQAAEGVARVTARVIDSRDARVLWTRQFERRSSDFFGLQDAVADGVLRALEAQIADIDPVAPPGPRSHSAAAQLAYLRGRTQLGRSTVVGSRAAAMEFEQALKFDPQFVPAMIGLYDARMQIASLLRTGMEDSLKANEPLLVTASRLEPDSGVLQIAKAMWSEKDPVRRIALFEAGLRKDPSNARAMTDLSQVLDSIGREQEAGRWLRQALRIDPLAPRIRFREGQRNFRNVGSAVEQHLLKMLELDPNYYPALQRHAKYRWQFSADMTDAVTLIERAIATDPENPWGPHAAVAFYLDANDPASADALARDYPLVRESTAAVRALYAGNWKRAAEAAMAPGSYTFNVFERWGVSIALRDHALRTGDTARVIRLLEQRHKLDPAADWHLDVENFREGQLIAHLLIASGQRDLGLRRLDEVVAWIDANGFMGPLHNVRTKAMARALQGKDPEALELLAESFRERDYTMWWYTLQFDPTWERFHGDPRFTALVREVRAHVAAHSERLAGLRALGQLRDRQRS